MQNVQYSRKVRLAPIMNQMIVHLLAVRPANDIAILSCLTDYLTQLDAALHPAGAKVAKEKKKGTSEQHDNAATSSATGAEKEEKAADAKSQPAAQPAGGIEIQTEQ
jgi:hypothetical protein